MSFFRRGSQASPFTSTTSSPYNKADEPQFPSGTMSFLRRGSQPPSFTSTSSAYTADEPLSPTTSTMPFFRRGSQAPSFISSTYSYTKVDASESLSQSDNSSRRGSIKDRVKSVLKDIGTSPFDPAEEHRRSDAAAWMTSMGPSRI